MTVSKAVKILRSRHSYFVFCIARANVSPCTSLGAAMLARTEKVALSISTTIIVQPLKLPWRCAKQRVTRKSHVPRTRKLWRNPCASHLTNLRPPTGRVVLPCCVSCVEDSRLHAPEPSSLRFTLRGIEAVKQVR